jgi:hypothetical protein
MWTFWTSSDSNSENIHVYVGVHSVQYTHQNVKLRVPCFPHHIFLCSKCTVEETCHTPNLTSQLRRLSDPECCSSRCKTMPNGPGPWPEALVRRLATFSRRRAGPGPCDPMALTIHTPFHAHHQWNPLLK